MTDSLRTQGGIKHETSHRLVSLSPEGGALSKALEFTSAPISIKAVTHVFSI